MRNKLVAAVFALLIVAAFAWGEQVQTPFDILGTPYLVVTAQAEEAEVLATDDGSGSSSKRAKVVKLSDGTGKELVLLLRVQRAPGGLFVDVIGDASVAALTSRVIDLEITGVDHPSPTKDAVDTAVLAAAAE